MGDLLYLGVIVLNHRNGLPEDQVNWTFHFVGPTGLTVGQDAVNVKSMLNSFLNDTDGGLANYLGPQIAAGTNAARAVVYSKDTLDPSIPWGVPKLDEPMDNDGIVAVDGLPSECAAVLSYHGLLTGVADEGPGGIRPRARLRGRVYIGPLNVIAADTEPTPFFTRLSDGILGKLLASGERLMDEGITLGLEWCVYSRTNPSAFTVVGGFVDNAFDTQRRRGEDATQRFIWP